MIIKTITTATLREVPSDPAQLAEAIRGEQATIRSLRQYLVDGYEELYETNLGRALQRVSEHLRLAGCFDEALQAKDEAIAIWDRLGRVKALFLTRQQRAVILHYASRHAEALEVMGDLEARFDDGTRVYADTLFEARARCLWEVGRGEDARAELERAMVIREARGNAAHIEKTRALMAAMGGE